MTITRKAILAANKYGLAEAAANDITYCSWYTPVLQIAYELGTENIDLSAQPDVTGWRRGDMPSTGISTNHATGDSERGLSVMALDGDDAHWSEMWSSERKRVDVCGILLPYTGSDDESLLLPYGVDDLDS